MGEDHWDKKDGSSGEDESTSKVKKSGRVLSSQKKDPKKAAAYWTPKEMARAKPRSLSRKPKKMGDDEN